MDIARVPSSEANKAPAKIFDRVFRGETIMLTRYGRDYVLLCPPPPEVREETPEPVSR